MNTFPGSSIVTHVETALQQWESGREGWPIDSEMCNQIGVLAQNDIDTARGLACSIARAGKGDVISFSPKVFVPLTHLCRDYCGYCTFRKDPGELSDLFMNVEQVMDVVKAGQHAGCFEALFTLGERPELKYREAKEWLADRGFRSTLDYLRHICSVVNEQSSLFPHANPGTMSRREILSLRESNVSMGLMLESTSENLLASGMPHEFAPSKRPLARLKTLRNAGQLKVPFTTGLLIGLGEHPSDTIEGIFAIKQINDSYGHIQEVIIQNFRAKPRTPMEGKDHASQDYLSWSLVCARIILGPDANIQVPPNLSPHSYQDYLGDGINDWGGISPVTSDYVNPEAKWPTIKSLKEACDRNHLTLKARFPVYPEFMDPERGFIEETLYDKVKEQSDEDGYVKGGLERYG